MSTIRVAGVKEPVSIAHIVYIIGRGNYSEVHTINGKHVLSSMTLKAIEGQSGEFVRIHKGALINPAFIQQVMLSGPIKKRSLASIIMQDGREFTIARRRNEALLMVKQPGIYS